MTRTTIQIFVHEIYSTTPKNNYTSNQTDVYHNDNIWSLDLYDLKDYGPKKIGVIDMFSW